MKNFLNKIKPNNLLFFIFIVLLNLFYVIFSSSSENLNMEQIELFNVIDNLIIISGVVAIICLFLAFILMKTSKN